MYRGRVEAVGMFIEYNFSPQCQSKSSRSMQSMNSSMPAKLRGKRGLLLRVVPLTSLFPFSLSSVGRRHATLRSGCYSKAVRHEKGFRVFLPSCVHPRHFYGTGSEFGEL